MIVRSIFRYPGSKSRLSICQSILSFFPSDIKEYREPFVGGGGIYFAQNRYEKRWLNDIDSNLISVYEILLKDPELFIQSCRQIPCIMSGSSRGDLKKQFEVFLEDPLSSPLKYFFLNRTCFSGRVRRGLTYFSNPEGWNITRSNGYLEKIADYMRGTRVSCGDYLPLLEEPGEGVFLYLDPVYYGDTEKRKTSKFYDNSFTVEDHERLFYKIGKCSHKWCMSYDNHPEILRLYRDYNIYNLDWVYYVSTENRNKGKELIITNCELDKVKVLNNMNREGIE